MRKPMKLWMAVLLTGVYLVGGCMTVYGETPEKMETVTGLYWDGPTAVWEEIEGCRRYQVQLYRDRSLVETVKVRETKKSFRHQMDRSGDFKFRVRALASDGSYRDSDWSQVSEGFAIDDAFAKAVKEAKKEAKEKKEIHTEREDGGIYIGPGEVVYPEAKWLEDQNGWWYRNQDGSYTKDNWQLIEDKWYFFDERGYMKTGWISWKDLWYYCDTDGAMMTNCMTPDKYWVNGDGVWVQ